MINVWEGTLQYFQRWASELPLTQVGQGWLAAMNVMTCQASIQLCITVTDTLIHIGDITLECIFYLLSIF